MLSGGRRRSRHLERPASFVPVPRLYSHHHGGAALLLARISEKGGTSHQRRPYLVARSVQQILPPARLGVPHCLMLCCRNCRCSAPVKLAFPRPAADVPLASCERLACGCERDGGWDGRQPGLSRKPDDVRGSGWLAATRWLRDPGSCVRGGTQTPLHRCYIARPSTRRRRASTNALASRKQSRVGVRVGFALPATDIVHAPGSRLGSEQEAHGCTSLG